jgi:hypothetical protein
MLRRLNNELDKSKKITDPYYDENNKELTFIYDNINVVSMKLPDSYPFYPPKQLHVNYQPIIYFYLGNKRIMMKYFDIMCICCTSITCPERWAPCRKLEHIMEEYYRFKFIINASIVIAHIERKNMLPYEMIKSIVAFING